MYYFKHGSPFFVLYRDIRDQSLFMEGGGGGHRREKGWVNKIFSE